MLSRRIRLRNGRDFRAVYSRSRSVACPTLVLVLRHWKNGRPDFANVESKVVRFGFSISKKTAKKAHDRNKIKRRLREIVRQRVLPRLKSDGDCDTIISVRAPALKLEFEGLAADVSRIFEESGLLV